MDPNLIEDGLYFATQFMLFVVSLIFISLCILALAGMPNMGIHVIIIGMEMLAFLALLIYMKNDREKGTALKT